jgi:amino acid transporter
MAQMRTDSGPSTAWLAVIIAALVMAVAAVGYAAFSQIDAPSGGGILRLASPRLPMTPPKLPDAPRLPQGQAG